MNNAYNVITLQVLLHIYCRPYAFEEDSPASNEAHERLLKAEMIRYSVKEGLFVITERGKFFVEHLLNIPFPITQWVIPKEEA